MLRANSRRRWTRWKKNNFYCMSSLIERAVEFFIREEVLKFGDFTLKSGKKSPYFFNTGSLCTGEQLAELGALYADKLSTMPDFAGATVIFGSAYKGIPIAVATAVAISKMGRKNMRAVSDRKEAKTHGDVSGFLGVIKKGDKVVIVDDVISTGGTKIEALEKLKEIGCESLGFIIAFDRQEKQDGSDKTAREALEATTGLPVYPLASASDIAAIKPEFAKVLEEHFTSA
jgi:orotate phosphoribosyltransferase